MKIFKAQANGNDYLVATVAKPYFDQEALGSMAAALCDRHFGIGSDGLVCVAHTASEGKSAWECRIFNPDGGEAEVSGNGLRCTAACLAFMGLGGEAEMTLQTKSGVKRLLPLGRQGNRFSFRMDMGEPVFNSTDIPMNLPEPCRMVRNYPLEVQGRRFGITALSMGNPHCVIFHDTTKETDWLHWSSLISRDPHFPRQTNVEWVGCDSSNCIQVSFWERGVGPTLSSGSGSCAAAVASILAGKAEEHLIVRSGSGDLVVDWHNRERVILTGDAEVLFEGTWLIPWCGDEIHNSP